MCFCVVKLLHTKSQALTLKAVFLNLQIQKLSKGSLSLAGREL